MAGGPAIPRPPGARPGAPPPWAGLTEAERRVTPARVRETFGKRFSLGRSDDRPPPPPAAPAATLVALFEEAGEVRVLLTRRSPALPVHAGEVALPGGRVNPGEGMVEAALREAAEEVGIPASDVEVLGWLDVVAGQLSGSVALPVVGLLPQRPRLTPDPDEVDVVFDVALAELMADGVYREERWDVPVPDRPMHFFDLPEHTIWGMTGRVLHQLLVAVTGRTPPPGSVPPPGPAGRTPPAPA